MPHEKRKDPETAILAGSPSCPEKHSQDEMPSGESGYVAGLPDVCEEATLVV